MLKAKKKLTKKELKEDQFVITMMKTQDWVTENMNQLLIGLAAVVGVVLLTNMYFSSKAAAEVDAAARLAAVQYEQTDVASAYNDIISTYEGTAAASKAAFFLAKYYFNQNELGEAKELFKSYIDESGDDNFMTQAAYAGYADCLLAEGNFKEAAENYERAAAADPNFPQSVAYLYSAASAYKSAGNTAKAKSLLTKVVDDYDNAVFDRRAQTMLETLSM